MRNYRDLEAYQRASSLFPQIYRLVRSWKPLDQRELGSQIIRAANSIHANIAEGFGKTPTDFKRYIAIAIGSCDELRSHLNDARNIGLIDTKSATTLLSEYDVVGKQLMRLKQVWH